MREVNKIITYNPFHQQLCVEKHHKTHKARLSSTLRLYWPQAHPNWTGGDRKKTWRRSDLQ